MRASSRAAFRRSSDAPGSRVPKKASASYARRSRKNRACAALGPADGLWHCSVANLDNVIVVAKRRLISRIAALKPRRVDEVKRALGFSLDWPELKQM